MAFVPIQPDVKYKGKLDMFGSVYDYFLTFKSVNPENNTFEYEHKIVSNGFVADQKTGNGKYSLNEDNSAEVRIEYEDPETEFRGVLNVSNELITGTTHQTHGFSKNQNGTFTLKADYE